MFFLSISLVIVIDLWVISPVDVATEEMFNVHVFLCVFRVRVVPY